MVNNKEATSEVDTGAKCNVLSLDTIQKINARDKINADSKPYWNHNSEKQNY